MVDVGHRDALRRAEHVAAGNVLRDLVHCRRAELVVRPHGAVHDAVVEHRPEVVRAGVAAVHGERVAAVALDHAPDAVSDGLPCLLPRDLHVHAVFLQQRPAQAVGVLVQLLERAALRADEPVAEHVVAVAADAHHLLARPHRDLQSARGLAQRAGADDGAVLRRGLDGGHPPTLPRPDPHGHPRRGWCVHCHPCSVSAPSPPAPRWMPTVSPHASARTPVRRTWRSA